MEVTWKLIQRIKTLFWVMSTYRDTVIKSYIYIYIYINIFIIVSVKLRGKGKGIKSVLHGMAVNSTLLS